MPRMEYDPPVPPESGGGSSPGTSAEQKELAVLEASDAWRADPSAPNIAALEGAVDAMKATQFLTADGFDVGDGRAVILRSAGVDYSWCTCPTSTDATDTAAALNVKMSGGWSPA